MAAKEVLLPCEFCMKMIIFENLYVHQSGCQQDIDTFQNLQLGENVCLLNESDELIDDSNVKLPCEFCDTPIVINNLICHQIICGKNYSKINNLQSTTGNDALVNNFTSIESNLLSKNEQKSKDELSNNEIFTSSHHANYFEEFSNKLTTKSSIQINSHVLKKNSHTDKLQPLSSINVLSNLHSSSKDYNGPTLVLRQAKLTGHQLHQNSSCLNDSSLLPHANINYTGAYITDQTLKKHYGDSICSSREEIKKHNKYSPGKNVSYNLIEYIRHFSASSPNVVEVHLASPTDHYRSTYGDKGWGCGYRNMQMLMSSMLLQMDYNEHISRVWEVEKGPLPRAWMPSISRLQQHLEKSWSMGIDEPGREQLGGTVYNTKKWIGATEVVAMLTALKIRTLIIDFHKPSGSKNTHPEMFHWLYEHFSNRKKQFISPVYIQHEGHSRTVVGVEKLSDGTILILVLDPSGHYDVLRTEGGMATMAHIRKSLHTFKAKKYQLVTVRGIMTSDSEFESGKNIISTRVP